MKTIRLKIADDVYVQLKRTLFTKALATSFGGIADEFLKKVVDAIEKGDKEKYVKFKKPKK